MGVGAHRKHLRAPLQTFFPRRDAVVAAICLS